MTRGRRTVRCGSVPTLALSLAMGGTVPAAATPQAGDDPRGLRLAAGAVPGGRTVTWLTGDRVRARVRVRIGSISVEPGPDAYRLKG